MTASPAGQQEPGINIPFSHIHERLLAAEGKVQEMASRAAELERSNRDLEARMRSVERVLWGLGGSLTLVSALLLYVLGS